MKSFQILTSAAFSLSIFAIPAPLQADPGAFTDSVTIDGTSTDLNLNNNTPQDWTIRSNSAGLSIRRGDTIPFLLDPNAGTSAVYVDSEGDTAFGTFTPNNDFNSKLHIEDFTPDIAFKTKPNPNVNPPIIDQTWSLYGNDVAFGVCDETTYPQTQDPNDDDVPCEPFIIQQGSPVDSLVIRDSGSVGLGTSNPEEKLHVVGPSATKLLVENTDAGAAGDQVMYELRNASRSKTRFYIQTGGRTWSFNAAYFNDFFEISRVGTGLTEFKVDASGNMTVRGNSYAKTHFDTSSRAMKTEFSEIDYQEVLAKVAQLQIPMWRYKSDDKSVRHLGPVAEDFHASFGVGDDKTISTVDSGGVALAAIKGLHLQLEQKNEEIGLLRQELDTQEEKILQLEIAIAEILRNQNSADQIGSIN